MEHSQEHPSRTALTRVVTSSVLGKSITHNSALLSLAKLKYGGQNEKELLKMPSEVFKFHQ